MDDVYAPPPGLPVLHEDRDLLIVDKPAGLLSVAGREVGWGDCAVSRAQATHPHVFPAHRLDMDTSGVLVLALRRSAERALQAQFAGRSVQKRYQAVVWGHPPDAGVIDLPLTRIGGMPPRNAVDPSGLPARTRYAVVARHAETALVDLFPETGRSHQLRVHLAALGHPILGDRLYAPPAVLAAAARLMLHAAEVSFDHPWTGARVTFRAPSPDGFA
jgi:tRNA pseudouridine32 synthase/23S rRNA pseudouridine746 synthase